MSRHLSDVNDVAEDFRRHRWPILIMSALVVTTVCACLLVVTTTPLLATPKTPPHLSDGTIGR